ncbi:MAG: ThuA domain-containing protein [Sphingobium sp.]|nr:MAG: ThuA domain-containing protein [Sphingobium sp.]
MKTVLGFAAGLMLGLLPAGQAAAQSVTDCPLRTAPFSIDLPLVDVLTSPAARGAVDGTLPEALTVLPPRFFSTRAPTFAAILTLRSLADMKGLSQAKLAAADTALRALPVTAADRVARCERYDNDRPAFDLPKGKPSVLVFEKMTGFRDGPSVDAARAALQAIGARLGWTVVVTGKGGAITPPVLRRFDAVVWNNVSGDVLTMSQRAALKAYVEGGGGFIGIHGAAGDPATFWDWYTDGLIGARFAGHPMKPQFQDARVVVEGRDSPLARGLPAEWLMRDEWYSFRANPRDSGARIVATLDEGSYAPVGSEGQSLRMGDHPIAWTRCVGRGRMFYTAIGHMPEAYAEPNNATMLENAVRWAAAKGAACDASAPAR